MKRGTNDFPVRVMAIAGVLAVLLIVAMWFVYGLGSPAENSQPSAGAEAPAPPIPDGEPATADEQSTSMTDGLADTEEVTLQLFVVDTAARRLIPRIQRIDAPMTLPSQAQLALDLLVRVREVGMVPPLPRDTVIREVWVSPAGVAYVDFAESFPALLAGGSLREIHAVYGVVATLTGSFPNIRSVQFLVDGEPVDTLTGHVDLSRPVEPLRDWVY